MEDEGNQNQKLMSERSAADNKIKSLEEQMTLSDDNISKVSSLVKILNSVSHTVREKDLSITNDSIFVLTDSVQQTTKKDVQEKTSYNFEIFSSNCVHADRVDALGFKDTKCVSNKFLITDFVKFLVIEDRLRDTGSRAWYESHGIFMRNDFMKHLLALVSRATARASQNIFKCKKQYDFCAQKRARDEFGVFDSKIANIRSTFNINLNKGETVINKKVFSVYMYMQCCVYFYTCIYTYTCTYNARIHYVCT